MGERRFRPPEITKSPFEASDEPEPTVHRLVEVEVENDEHDPAVIFLRVVGDNRSLTETLSMTPQAAYQLSGLLSDAVAEYFGEDTAPDHATLFYEKMNRKTE